MPVESRALNAVRGITGLLLYRSGRVMQMLEGDAGEVRTLYDRIRMDVRHHQVTNVWTSKAVERRFPSRSMGFDDLERDGEGTLSQSLSAARRGRPSSSTTSIGAGRRCVELSSAATGSSVPSASP